MFVANESYNGQISFFIQIAYNELEIKNGLVQMQSIV